MLVVVWTDVDGAVTAWDLSGVWMLKRINNSLEALMMDRVSKAQFYDDDNARAVFEQIVDRWAAETEAPFYVDQWLEENSPGE